MYVCKECGNYYQFNGNASVSITNKIYKGGDYQASPEERIEGYDLVCCAECGSNAVVDTNIKTLPERLKEEIYNTATMGCINEDVAKSLKKIVSK
jgi:hypothetical protein